MKKEILSLSMCLPYSMTNHAGGKTANFYFNKLAEYKDFHLTLICKVLKEEKKYYSSLNQKIDYRFVTNKRHGLAELFDQMYSLNSKFNPNYVYGNVLRKSVYDAIKTHLLDLKEKGYQPDVILTMWTQMSLFIKEIKNIFPNVPCIAIEEDVAFQVYQRKYEYANSSVKKKYYHKQYLNMKKREVEADNVFDIVYVHTKKDLNLLVDAGVSGNVKVIPAYYDRKEVHRKPNGKDVLFWGNMSRPENYLSAIWFIENVMPLLSDLNFRFVVLGGNPHESLLKYKSDRVVITGFIDDPSEYFESVVCLVAPLVLGAGVKVKILEALSAGIPVLTNQIGIEGIEAVNGKDYFHCEKAEEYASTLGDIFNGTVDAQKIGENAIRFMKGKYDLDEEMDKLIISINKLMK